MPDEAKRAADQDRSRDAIERRAGLIVGHRFVVAQHQRNADRAGVRVRDRDADLRLRGLPDARRGHVVGRQTFTTVGYGDVPPTTGAGRVVGGVLMVVGVMFISFLTASVTTSLIRRDDGSSAHGAGEAGRVPCDPRRHRTRRAATRRDRSEARTLIRAFARPPSSSRTTSPSARGTTRFRSGGGRNRAITGVRYEPFTDRRSSRGDPRHERHPHRPVRLPRRRALGRRPPGLEPGRRPAPRGRRAPDLGRRRDRRSRLRARARPGDRGSGHGPRCLAGLARRDAPDQHAQSARRRDRRRRTPRTRRGGRLVGGRRRTRQCRRSDRPARLLAERRRRRLHARRRHRLALAQARPLLRERARRRARHRRRRARPRRLHAEHRSLLGAARWWRRPRRRRGGRDRPLSRR